MSTQANGQHRGEGARVARRPPRRTSRILLRYIACEFAVPLFCCLGGFIALFVVTDVFDVLQDFLKADAPAGTVVLFFALRQPANLVNVLPMSVLLAASFMMNVLGRHHEITALKASGLSLIRCCLPVWTAALVFSGLTYWLNERLAPECSLRADELHEALTTSKRLRNQGRAKLAYRNEREHRDWFFEVFSWEGEKRGVLIKQFRPDGSILWELRAAGAEYCDDLWVFLDGAVSHFDSEGALPEGPEQHFTRYVARDLREMPRQIMNSMLPAEALSLREIRRLLRTNPNLPARSRRAFLTTLWYRLSFPFSCLLAALLGVSLCVTRERGSALRGFALAVGIMVLYYLTGQFFVLLGKNGAVPPIVAGCLPTLLFVVWGSRAVYRAR